jgi:hypothetical protein
MPIMGILSASETICSGYCVFITTVCEGLTPLVRGAGGLPFVFATRREAECDIVDTMQIRLNEFIAGERDFEDAITVEEYVVEVSVLRDGRVLCADGQIFE